jgi:hypothetical protein
MSINNMPQRRLGGLSAYELLFQSQPRLPIDLRWKLLKEDVPDFKVNEEGMTRFINQRAAEHRALWEKAKSSLRKYEQQSRKNEKFSVGDLVMIPNHGRKKRDRKHIGPFVIIEVRPRSVKVALADGTPVVEEISGCRRYIPSLSFGRGSVPSEIANGERSSSITTNSDSAAGGEFVRTDHEATDTRAEVAEDESEGPV